MPVDTGFSSTHQLNFVILSKAKDLLSHSLPEEQTLRFDKDAKQLTNSILHFTFTFFGFLNGRNAIKSA
jgi:hypothetical protein